ncbi:MAG TPA: hypothetical protein PL009_11830 [Flavipsychrobacter sp.]|nr:hypothetical protein [Flavipsychrobacter sp.]
MKNNFLKAALLSAIFGLAFSACKKDPAKPVEQELITTVRLNVMGNDGFAQSFSYKVENGFGNSPGSIQIDTLKLMANTSYSVSAQVLNEKETPPEDVTLEVIQEMDKHMFTYLSTPISGAGAVKVATGNMDHNGMQFYQSITLETGAAGSGQLKVTLQHFAGEKPSTAFVLSETDAEAIFPVILQ